MRFDKQVAPVAVAMALSLMTSFTAQAAPPASRAPVSTKANLVAHADKWDTDGYIKVTNIGSLDAPASHTRLIFNYGSGESVAFDLRTLQLPPGETVTIYLGEEVEKNGKPFTVCAEADCGGEVDEDSEGDNEDCVRHVGS
jgi:hypothetical protein